MSYGLWDYALLMSYDLWDYALLMSYDLWDYVLLMLLKQIFVLGHGNCLSVFGRKS